MLPPIWKTFSFAKISFPLKNISSNYTYKKKKLIIKKWIPFKFVADSCKRKLVRGAICRLLPEVRPEISSPSVPAATRRPEDTAVRPEAHAAQVPRVPQDHVLQEAAWRHILRLGGEEERAVCQRYRETGWVFMKLWKIIIQL